MELKSIGMGATIMLAIAFSACTANDELEEFATSTTDKNVIGFRVQTSNPTRSASSYSKSYRPSNFKVMALDGESNYFGGLPERVSSNDDGNTWTTDNQRYWPTNKSDNWKGLTFYAYIDGTEGNKSLSSASSFNLSGSVASFENFEVEADTHKQTDLMYAVAKDVKKSSFGGNVSLNFRHALSQICFTAQNNHPLYKEIEIVSIELGGVKGKGSYTFPELSTDAGASDFYRNANLSKGVWTIAKEESDCSYSIREINTILDAPDESCKGKVVNISSPKYNSGNGNDEISNTMYLIPQKVEAKKSENAETGAYIKVKVRITTTYAPEESKEYEKFIPIDIDWKEGQSYTYNISWNATPISFSVTVDDYDDVEVTQN